MVERRLLSTDFVNSVECPTRGECWIADTEVRGFGLRLWNNRYGDGAAFAVRTSDKNGRSIRKTFHISDSTTFLWRLRILLSTHDRDLSNGTPLGLFLDDARIWAKEVIGQAKGRLRTREQKVDVESEYLETRRFFQSQIEEMTLGRAAEIIISYGPYRGWSERYMDRMNSIFFSNIPPEMQNTRIAQITETQIMSALASDHLKASNLRTLRTLLHQIFGRIQEMGGPALLQYLPYYERRSIDEKPSRLNLFISKLERSDFEILFEHLEIESEKWPHLFCLRLIFELNAPMSRLMAARWHQIVEDRWYPFGPQDRKNWYFKWSRINSRSCRILERAFENAQKDVGGSPFWFPSRMVPGQHISNTDRVWRSILQAAGWPYGSVSCFAAHYRRLTLFDDILHSPEDLRQRAAIMAKLSKFSPENTLYN